jgi:hypothetical protein
VESAPLVIVMGKASCVVATRICNASSDVAMRLMRLPRLADRVSLCAFRWCLSSPFLGRLPRGGGCCRRCLSDPRGTASVACVRAGVTRCTVLAAAGCRACRMCSRIAHESTVAPPSASDALDPTNLRLRKSRRVSPSGPVA